MNEELIGSSDKYVKKSNKMLLLVGLGALLLFFIGLVILLSGGDEGRRDAEVTVTGGADAFSNVSAGQADVFDPFDKPSSSVSLLVSPDNLRFDQVVLGTSAEGALTVSASSSMDARSITSQPW